MSQFTSGMALGETHLTSQRLNSVRDKTRGTPHLPHACDKIRSLQHPAQCLALGQCCGNHSFTSLLPSNLTFFASVNFYEGACLLTTSSSSFILRVPSGKRNSHQPLAPFQHHGGCDVSSPVSHALSLLLATGRAGSTTAPLPAT